MIIGLLSKQFWVVWKEVCVHKFIKHRVSRMEESRNEQPGLVLFTWLKGQRTQIFFAEGSIFYSKYCLGHTAVNKSCKRFKQGKQADKEAHPSDCHYSCISCRIRCDD